MSLDDTIELDDPVACPVCGTSHTEFRIHELGRNFTRYRIGTLCRYPDYAASMIEFSVAEYNSA
ncbi:MAG: hypothetical protein WCO60_19100 [Verrucomicrobiota bacterium]